MHPVAFSQQVISTKHNAMRECIPRRNRNGEKTMRSKKWSGVLLLLLALLFGARILVAQNGYQYFTVYGTGGDSGVVWVELLDEANNGYYATYSYGPSDTPLTAATALAQNLYASYGWNGVINSGNLGTTIYVQLSASTIKTIGNGYFSYIGEARQSPVQTLYIVDDGFLSPVSSATPGPPPVVPPTMPQITYNADGSVTIGDTSSTSAPPLTGEPSAPTPGIAYLYTDPTTGQVTVLSSTEVQAMAFVISAVTGMPYNIALAMYGPPVQTTTNTVPDPSSDLPTDPSGSTGAPGTSWNIHNSDGSITVVSEDANGNITTTYVPPPTPTPSSPSGGQNPCGE
jgi:hypothetical protein